ncbi:MAG: MASE3 domain-containing protein, partial [Planctomycetota bacterium]
MPNRSNLLNLRTSVRPVLFYTSLLAGLWFVSLSNYLLFHTVAELTGIVVACCIFVIAWNSRRVTKNTYLLFLGIAYLFVAALDLLHTLSYEGMGVFSDHSSNLATQLWI